MSEEQNGSDAVTPSPGRLGSVNWQKDEWFAEYHADTLTDEFKAWWIENYYGPDKYGQSDDEQHEYWTRCAFALMGWNAARNPNT